jgi:hypothetical protein
MQDAAPTFRSLYFDRDIASHTMQVIRDDGVNRHVRFQRPGTMCMHFDLLTWPGYLCYTGDMGTFVFKRLHDMFEFFRRDTRAEYRMDKRYWAEKLEASDRCDGVREWSADKFKAEVRDFFERHTSDEDGWTDARRAALWSEIDEQVCAAAGDSEHHAWVALWEFEHDGFRFQDWERDCKEWTHRFEWCCHALEWAIAKYDGARTSEPSVEAADQDGA